MPAEPTRAAKAFLRTANLYGRASTAVTAVLQGVFLGILSEDEYAWIDERVYAAATEQVGGASTYFDDRYNLQGLFDWEAEAIGSAFRPGSKVLVTSAGAGREVIALAEMGFDVVAYEPNETLAEAGNDLLARLALEARILPAGRNVFPAGAGPCDGVVIGWGAYNHIPGSTRRVALLRDARARISAGDPLLVSFHVRDASSRQFRITAAIANVIRRIRRRPPVEIGDGLRLNYQHHFTRREIEQELEAAGFRVTLFAERPYGFALGEAA